MGLEFNFNQFNLIQRDLRLDVTKPDVFLFSTTFFLINYWYGTEDKFAGVNWTVRKYGQQWHSEISWMMAAGKLDAIMRNPADCIHSHHSSHYISPRLFIF